jgi:hypothetical protein
VLKAIPSRNIALKVIPFSGKDGFHVMPKRLSCATMTKDMAVQFILDPTCYTTKADALVVEVLPKDFGGGPALELAEHFVGFPPNWVSGHDFLKDGPLVRQAPASSPFKDLIFVEVNGQLIAPRRPSATAAAFHKAYADVFALIKEKGYRSVNIHALYYTYLQTERSRWLESFGYSTCFDLDEENRLGQTLINFFARSYYSAEDEQIRVSLNCEFVNSCRSQGRNPENFPLPKKSPEVTFGDPVQANTHDYRLLEKGKNLRQLHDLSSLYDEVTLPDSFYGSYVGKFIERFPLATAKDNLEIILHRRLNLFLGKNKFYKDQHQNQRVSPSHLLLTAVALDMDYEEATDFFKFCSYYPNPKNPFERFYLEVIKNSLHYNDPVALAKAFEDRFSRVDSKIKDLYRLDVASKKPLNVTENQQ